MLLTIGHVLFSSSSLAYLNILKNMKKIKGQGKLTKMLASKVATFNKNNFNRYISEIDKLKQFIDYYGDKTIDVEVVSFSSAHDFSEQVLSILSFIKNVGLPATWTVYSDGTHTSEQIKKLESEFTFLKLIKTDFIDAYIRKNIKPSLLPYQEILISYANKFALGKRLFLYLNYFIVKPTIFIDSDIMFYQKADCLSSIINHNENGWFLPDADWNNLDSRYMAITIPQLYQVNGGLFIINKELAKLSKGLDFLESLNDTYEYFSDQTVIHIILLENNFMPLDPRIFALNSGDQFDFGYLYPKGTIAVRHYTGPVRHKMWQRDWKWHLSLS